MVVHHVKDDSNASFMTGIYQRLEVVFCSVSFVDCEIKGRVVSPAVIAIELVYRHEFQSLDTQILKIVQAVFNELQRSFFGKVAHEEFVNHKVFLIGPDKVGVAPVKCLLPRCENAHRPRSEISGIRRNVWIRRFRNPRIVPLVQDDLGIGICHADVVRKNVVLVTIVFARIQICQLEPKRFPVTSVIHQ